MEGSALAGCALDERATAVEFGDLLHDRKPEPGAFILFIIDRRQLRELLEELREVFLLDPDAGVLDNELHGGLALGTLGRGRLEDGGQ